MKRGYIHTLLCAGLLGWLIAPAQAQSEPDEPHAQRDAAAVDDAVVEPEGYASAVDAALAAHQQGAFEEARVQLRKAHSLFPNARTLRGLGKIEYELRNYVQAISHLDAALSCETRPLDARLQAEVHDLLARARMFVGEVQINIAPDSAAASVFVQDDELPDGDRGPSPLLRANEDGPRPRLKRWVAISLTAASAVGAAIALGVWLRPTAERSNGPDGGTSGIVLRNP